MSGPASGGTQAMTTLFPIIMLDVLVAHHGAMSMDHVSVTAYIHPSPRVAAPQAPYTPWEEKRAESGAELEQRGIKVDVCSENLKIISGSFFNVWSGRYQEVRNE